MSSKSPGKTRRPRQLYPRFADINGSHPLQQAVPDAWVPYRVRTRPGGKLMYFNLDLARTMGLIPRDHEPVLNSTLTRVILDTFSLQIINEYDQVNNTRIPPEQIRPGTYMATRYLQLQHRDRRGLHSGDGRSIWNGCLRGPGGWWDISSCGTGATCLSPAAAQEGRPIRTGDRMVSYGCGRASWQEGLGAAINSEIFHANGISTERTLAIITFADGSSINVRAAPNLIRPAHLFRYLKQGDYPGLRAITNYHIDRQVGNGRIPGGGGRRRQYQYLLRQICQDFARVSAVYESEYIFCWMDWDGDNILNDGGIIDYGSIRQFGLYHREYRYDDVDRMSTSIPQQKFKARQIVQTWAQLTDFLMTGKRRPLRDYRRHPILAEFDRVYQQYRDQLLLWRLGYDWDQIETILAQPTFRTALREFTASFRYFEHTQSTYGTYEVTDGITSDAVFCMRDVLRELPRRLLAGEQELSATDFIRIAGSRYARPEDLRLFPYRRRRIRLLQRQYQRLYQLAARYTDAGEPDVLQGLETRSSLINRYERVTGDALIAVTNIMARVWRDFGANEMLRVFRHFLQQQILNPDYPHPDVHRRITPGSRKLLERMFRSVRSNREGI